MKLVQCPDSKLMLPRQFVDERKALVSVLNEYVDKVVQDHQWIEGTYFLTLHAKFDPLDPESFCIDQPKITKKLPPFLSNSLVWWICNRRGIVELLWMVPPTKKGEQKIPEFNTQGAAYLQAKGAMPKSAKAS